MAAQRDMLRVLNGAIPGELLPDYVIDAIIENVDRKWDAKLANASTANKHGDDIPNVGDAMDNGPDARTPHELVNQAVAHLHVICTGQENRRLYFEKLPGACSDNEKIVQNIARAICEVVGLRNAIDSVKTISLTE